MNFIQKLLNRHQTETAPQIQHAEIMTGSAVSFTPWTGDAYANDIYRAAVDAIARNAAKLKGSHVVKSPPSRTIPQGGKLNRLLQVQPNPYMTAYDMLYKLITHYFLNNNAFAYLEKDAAGELLGVYPVGAAGADFLADPTGSLYVKFRFAGGKSVVLPYSDIIHLRRHFNGNDLLGDSNTAILPALELASTQNEGIISGIKTGARIRGILKYTQIMSAEKLREEKDRFMGDYLSMANSGGVVATDQKTDYTPINTTPYSVDTQQMQAAKTKIYDYLGISEAIVNSSYNENQWSAFYESVVEPISLQLSLEFTRKIFTDREQAFGNSILFESGRLQFASNRTKIALIGQLMPYGLLTVNQALEVLNLPSVEDGDRRLQTLNMIDAAKANKYQLAQKLTKEDTNDEGDPDQ